VHVNTTSAFSNWNSPVDLSLDPDKSHK